MDLQRNKLFLLMLTAFTMFLACGVTERAADAGSSHSDSIREVPYATSLADILVRVPGVFLDWRTGEPTIRGGVPLYVVDGVRVGHDFFAVERLVSIHDVASVEVIKSGGNALQYGRDVGNGVIIIHTKTGREGSGTI